MKSQVLCLILGVICIGAFSIASAQAQKSANKAASSAPPREVCRAIEAYVAKVDAAKSMSDPSARAKQYEAAKQDLETVLKKRNQTELLGKALDYVPFTEQVVTTEATNPKLNEYLAKRSKLREALLEICSDYTTTR
jgi:hypothetical protein